MILGVEKLLHSSDESPLYFLPFETLDDPSNKKKGWEGGGMKWDIQGVMQGSIDAKAPLPSRHSNSRMESTRAARASYAPTTAPTKQRHCPSNECPSGNTDGKPHKQANRVPSRGGACLPKKAHTKAGERQQLIPAPGEHHAAIDTGSARRT